MELPKRKTTRLPDYNYSSPGYYFITVCTKGKQKLLCDIVGTGLPDGPRIRFTQQGKIVENQLQSMTDFYEDIVLDKFIIMPNHVHMIIQVLQDGNGPSGRPVPTNSKISKFIGTFKRFCNREIGGNIWQYRSYDHIIRGKQDYQKIWNYIQGNPSKWLEDCFYVE